MEEDAPGGGGPGAGEEEEEAWFEEGDGEVVADLDSDDDVPDDDLEDDDDEDGDAAMGAAEAGPPPAVPPPGRDDAAASLARHGDPVYAVAWSRTNADLVATGGGDDRAFLWELGSGRAVALEGHTDSVACVAFSHVSAALATGGMDGKVLVWDGAGRLQHKLEGPNDAVEWVAWHPKGEVLLAGSTDYTTWMWSASSGTYMQMFGGHGGPVTCGAFLPDGKSLVTGSADGTLKWWDPRTAQCTHTFEGDFEFHEQMVTALDCHPDSNLVLTGGADGRVCLVNLANRKVAAKLQGHADGVEAVGLCGTLPLAASGGLDGKAFVWDLHTLQPRYALEHGAAVIKLLWHPAQPYLLTAALDGRVRAWDARNGTCLRTFEGHTMAILDMAVSATGDGVLTGSDDKLAKVFKL